MVTMERETDKYIDSIAKRVYPLTEKEKNCVNEFVLMKMKRSHLKKAIIETISKYEQPVETQVLDSAGEQKEANS